MKDELYTLGQLYRCVYPDAGHDRMTGSTITTILTKPASGLGLLSRETAAFRDADRDEIGLLLNKLPADLSDPAGGVSEEDQAAFWLGYYHYLSAIDCAKKHGRDDFVKIGKSLFGDRWQSALAKELGVDSRRVRQWVTGDRPIPVGIWAELASLLRTRQARIADILKTF